MVQFLLQLPLFESEMRKAAGVEGTATEEDKDKESKHPSGEKSQSQASRLVTSDGTYATQSAFSMTQTKKVGIVKQ